MSSLERQLSAQVGGLRSLARSLVGAQDADDLVQEAALAALAVPPAREGRMGGWLAQVVRHLASKHRRTEARRQRREAAVEPRPPSASPEGDAVTRETFARLTAAVLSLPEPYQDVILRRYLREEAPAAIAAQTGVPLATVKSRLQRGLEMLRQRLNHEGGDWRRALVLAAGLRPGTGVIAAAAGGIAMGMGMKVGLGAAAALLVAASWAWWKVAADEPDASHAATAARAATETTPAASPPDDVYAAATTENRLPAVAADTATLRGRVVDHRGQPLAGVPVALAGWPVRRFDLERAVAQEPPAAWNDPPLGHTGDDGRFTFAFVPPPAFAFCCTFGADPETSMRTESMSVTPAEQKDLGDLVLPAPGSMQGIVVDTEGCPLAGVTVNVVPRDGHERAAVQPTSYGANATTDAHGAFAIAKLPPRVYGLGVDGRSTTQLVLVQVAAAGTARVQVVVLRPGEQQTIRGRVVDERGAPVADAGVSTRSLVGSDASSRTLKDGTFVLERPEQSIAAALPVAVERDGYEVLQTEPVAWGTEDVELTLRAGLILEISRAGAGGAFTAQVAPLLEGIRRQYESFTFQHTRIVEPPATVARLGPVRRGAYLVRVLDAAGIASAAVEVDVRDPGPVRVALQVPRVTSTTLRVVDHEGNPVAGSLVELVDPLGQAVHLDTYAWPRSQWDQRQGSLRRVELLQAGRTDAAGELRLQGPRRDDLALRLRSDRHEFFVVQPFALGADEVEVKVPRGADLIVRVEPAALIAEWRERAGLPAQGPVAGVDRDRLPGIKVTRGRDGVVESWPGTWEPPLPFADDGTCTLHGLPPATWLVHLRLPRGGEGLMFDDVTLRAGETRELVLPLHGLRSGTWTGRVLLNGLPLPSASIHARVEVGRRSGMPQSLSDSATTDSEGVFSLRPTGGLARVYILGRWPGTGEQLSIQVPEPFAVVAGGTVTHDVHLRMARVRFTFRDSAGKPIDGLPAHFFGTQPLWSRPSDREGRSPWMHLAAGPWRIAAMPKRLLDPVARQAFEDAHEGDQDAWRRELVDFGSVEVVVGEDQEIDVRVPDEWFR